MKEVLRRDTHGTPSAEIEQQIDALLAVGVGENPREALSELGARLIIQRAVEDEFDAWLGRRAMSAGRRRRHHVVVALRQTVEISWDHRVRRRSSPMRAGL
jgi:hypothetical protein